VLLYEPARSAAALRLRFLSIYDILTISIRPIISTSTGPTLDKFSDAVEARLLMITHTHTHSEWQWHQLGHMQVCTSLQTDNHVSTPPLSFLQAGCPTCRSTNSIKALKALNADDQSEVNFRSPKERCHGNQVLSAYSQN